ncbi:MAG: hypothetical protein NC041_03160 [Bacteroides sp.]|nr:hypothetical protein [Prevotella sp.]MCM1408391.1 hypothetical protein [Treponema brennaborense]MCM1469447.1 hypothetical protein [Bacteroides sp.]
MTLAAKFTGIENMNIGWCHYYKNDVSINIYNASDVYYECYSYKNSSGYTSSVYYNGEANTEDKTIVFTIGNKYDGDDELAEKIKTGEIKPVINASYTEDIENGTVTITFEDGSSFVCEFDSETVTQTD